MVSPVFPKQLVSFFKICFLTFIRYTVCCRDTTLKRAEININYILNRALIFKNFSTIYQRYYKEDSTVLQEREVELAGFKEHYAHKSQILHPPPHLTTQ